MNTLTLMQAGSASNLFTIILLVLLIITCLASLIFLSIVGGVMRLWFQAALSNAPVLLTELIRMKFQRVDPKMIIEARIKAVNAGVDVSVDQLTRHFLAGDSVPAVVDEMIAISRQQRTPAATGTGRKSE